MIPANLRRIDDRTFSDGRTLSLTPQHFLCRLIHLVIFILSLLSLPVISEASANDIEKDIQNDFTRSKTLAHAIKKNLERGTSVSSELTKLKAAAEDIRLSSLLLEKRFHMREERAKSIGSVALGRHHAMMKGYHEALKEYLSLTDSLPSNGSISQDAIRKLQSLLEKLLPKKKRPITGSVPYKHLNLPSRQLTTAASVTPAYLGGNKTVSPDDTAPAPEAPISTEIATLAQSLNWNPVSIYEYVKNNIDTEWYYGCMKGAEDTIHQKSGNDCDQAALLAALLRASGFPTRYVRGIIQFFPDIEKEKNLTGIDDPAKIAEYFQKAGIPYNTVIAGGKIANIQIEHVWVESLIPYANYRGAIIDEHGKTWLGLDTNIKVKGYTYNSAPDILSVLSLSAIRDEYLGLVTAATPSTPFELDQTPLEYLKSSVNEALSVTQTTTTYSDYLRSKTIVPEVLNILPGSLQFTLIKATNEYTTLPDDLIHKVKFIATDSNKNELLTVTLPLYKLSNQQIVISYDPETVQDQEIIDSYGGLDNTPAYLIHLRPVLKVNDERIVVAQGGVPMGEEVNLAIDLISPNGRQSITNSHIVGNLSVIGISSQRAVITPSPLAREAGPEPVERGGGEGDAARLLYEEAMTYIDRWNKAEDELAALLHLSISRPLPAVVTLGGVIDVTYFLGIPHSFTWKGEYIDADLRTIEIVRSQASGVSGDERQKLFMQLSSLQGSILENRIFEDDFKTESISTAKLMQIVNQGSGGHGQGSSLLTIDKTNIETMLPTLPFDDNIKEDIQNTVNQNFAIRIPRSEVTYQDWTGVGYIKENIQTAESGWMLSGMIAGGMTAVSPAKWTSQDGKNILSNPYHDTVRNIYITSPKNESTITTPDIVVTGIVLDPNATVTVNGIQAEVNGATFTAITRLTSGTNIITATAVNKVGRSTFDTIVIRCKISLKMFITYPFEGAELSMSPIYVEGIVSDPTASVFVSGIPAIVSTDGGFIANNVTLAEGTNQIIVSAMNADGDLDSQTITINYHAIQPRPSLSLSITSPASGATIDKSETSVIGTITTTAAEAWVTVNNRPATLYNDQFIINNVTLTEGSNKIIVNAMDSNGAIGRAETTVTASISAPRVQLSANITSGIAPLTTYFAVSTSLTNTVSSCQLDYEGDGTIDYTGADLENVIHTYTAEGIFHPKVTVTDSKGNIYSDTIDIVILNRLEVDALLKSKWNGMKTRLAAQDVVGAASYFNSTSKDRYAEVFTALGNRLPQIVQNMQDVQLIYVKNNSAKYRIRKNEMYGGQQQEITYYIYFEVDENGMWKIVRF